MTPSTRPVRVAAMGDLHVGEGAVHPYRDLFAQIAREADILVLAGDLTNYGKTHEVEILCDDLRTCQGEALHDRRTHVGLRPRDEDPDPVEALAGRRGRRRRPLRTLARRHVLAPAHRPGWRSWPSSRLVFRATPPPASRPFCRASDSPPPSRPVPFDE